MKKSLKTAISLLLFAAFLSTSASAAGGSRKVNEQIKYVSLGDSIADGIGLPGNPLRGPDQEDKRKVYCYKTIGAYPSLVAAALGVRDENFAQLACAGMRSVELRACLDPTYTIPDKRANNFMGNELEEWVKNCYDYRSFIKDADLITLNIGANDIAAYALLSLREALKSEGVSNSVLDALTGCPEKDGEYTSALARLLQFSSQLGRYTSAAKAAINGLYDGYNRWIENWDAIVGIIYRLNPDVTLVCLGIINPFRHLKITDHSPVEIGAAVDGIVASINYWSAVGSRYSGRYLYVDIMGIETLGDEKGISLTDSEYIENMELNAHPSEKGQQQIAERILKKLPYRYDPFYRTISTQVKAVNRTVINSIVSPINKLVGTVLGYF